jgi:hypothetical protein
MFNGKVVPTKAVGSGLAKELQSNVPLHEAGHRNQTVTPGKTLGVVSQP